MNNHLVFQQWSSHCGACDSLIILVLSYTKSIFRIVEINFPSSVKNFRTTVVLSRTYQQVRFALATFITLKCKINVQHMSSYYLLLIFFFFVYQKAAVLQCCLCLHSHTNNLHVYRIRFRFEIIAQYLERMSNFPKQHREQKSLSYYKNKQQNYSLIHYYISLWHERSFLKNGVYVQFSLGRMSSTHAILWTPVLRSEKFA